VITVTIHRKTLVDRNACGDGLDLYDAIAGDDECIRVEEWTPLHAAWPYAAGYGALARWLEDEGIIPRANLGGAYLSGANLREADLYGADLGGADLRGADLYGANLGGADLRRADLYGANLGGAYLGGADLCGANLSGTNLSGTNLSGAYRGDSPAPPGWKKDARGYLERDGGAG
jgi:hypothetical protein